MTTRIVKIPLYSGKLRIDILDEPTESKLFKKIFDNSDINHNDGEWVGFTFIQENNVYIMLRRKYGDLTGLDPGTIAHESFHAAYEILNWAGVKVDVKHQEAFAYMLTWVVDEVHKTVKQDKKRKS